MKALVIAIGLLSEPALAACDQRDSDDQALCQGRCSAIYDRDKRNACDGNCTAVVDDDLRAFCKADCSAIGNVLMRDLCREVKAR